MNQDRHTADRHTADPHTADPHTADLAGGRTLTARSVLASALLGEEPPELPVAHLVRLAGLFGIAPNRARVALSRMVATGEATSDGSGRYRLAGHLVARRLRQATSRLGTTRPWSGDWSIVVITGGPASADVRVARRRALHAARLAERREGLWLRPDNVELVLADPEELGVERYRGRPDSDAAALAAALWDLQGWARRAGAFIDALGSTPTQSADDLAPGFLLSAAVLRHLQADPLLPPVLLPEGWPGALLRSTYNQWDRHYRLALRQWGRSEL